MARVVVSANSTFHRGRGWPNSLALEILAQACGESLSDGSGESAPESWALAGCDEALFAGPTLLPGRYLARVEERGRWKTLWKVRATLLDEEGAKAAEATLILTAGGSGVRIESAPAGVK